VVQGVSWWLCIVRLMSIVTCGVTFPVISDDIVSLCVLLMRPLLCGCEGV